MNETKSQNEIILEMLKANEMVTPYTALAKAKSLRLSERIREIRALGYNVTARMIKLDNGKRVAEYFLCDD